MASVGNFKPRVEVIPLLFINSVGIPINTIEPPPTDALEVPF
jgi:hypothetical protein